MAYYDLNVMAFFVGRWIGIVKDPGFLSGKCE